MMVGAHLISSGRKFQSEAAAVSINLFPNLTVLLRFGTSDGVFADVCDAMYIIIIRTLCKIYRLCPAF